MTGFKQKNVQLLAVAAFLISLLAACGGGGGASNNLDGNNGNIEETIDNDDGNVVVSSNEPNFGFFLGSSFAEDFTESYTNFIGRVFSSAVEPLNRIPNVFRGEEIPVIYRECGTSNAFYSPSIRRIILCDELSRTAFTYYAGLFEDDDIVLAATFRMMTFVLYHEIGHALDDLRDLGVGGNFESVADAIGVVLSVRTGQALAPINAGLFFLANGEGSFADVHGNGTDRAGDMLCWTLGSSSTLAAEFSTISQSFVEAGRDCVAEYANQFEFVAGLIPNLRDVPPITAVRNETSMAATAKIDQQLSELLSR